MTQNEMIYDYLKKNGSADDEEWREIPGLRGFYSISNYGRLKRNKRKYLKDNKYVIELKEKDKLINTILEFGIFMDECPLNFGFDDNSIKSKAQNVFYEDNEEWCEKNCNECYKKCWLKYFKEIQRLEENK